MKYKPTDCKTFCCTCQDSGNCAKENDFLFMVHNTPAGCILWTVRQSLTKAEEKDIRNKELKKYGYVFKK